MLKKIFRFILKQKHYISSDSYISFLKSKGHYCPVKVDK